MSEEARLIRQATVALMRRGVKDGEEHVTGSSRCITYIDPSVIDATVPLPDEVIDIVSTVASAIPLRWSSFLLHCLYKKTPPVINPRRFRLLPSTGVQYNDDVVAYVLNDEALASVDWVPYVIGEWKSDNTEIFINAVNEARYVVHMTYILEYPFARSEVKHAVEYIAYDPLTFPVVTRILKQK